MRYVKGKSVSSHTKYNFSKKESKEFEESTEVPSSPFTTVVHEMSHQYDYDQGNMGDSKPSSATDPVEIRAVNLENIARYLEGLLKKTKYRGEIDPKKIRLSYEIENYNIFYCTINVFLQ